ncbi:MAG: arginase family protein, partial [Proteobacteria bacterium]|nr:arginase family protein [Pseudomonadota bacterium]
PDLPVEKIVSSLKENVYLTFDLDALDSSIMPSVGTPEPGGIDGIYRSSITSCRG